MSTNVEKRGIPDMPKNLAWLLLPMPWRPDRSDADLDPSGRQKSSEAI
jgi:hypothetical protein